jgi:threonine dehydratase
MLQLPPVHPDLGRHVRETPTWTISGDIFGIPDCKVTLKLEHLQIGGSFKARGMFNHLLFAKVPGTGAVIASGGNAGIAAAYAAQAFGHHLEVFVPEISSRAKQAQLLTLGAQVEVVGGEYAQASAAAAHRAQESGALAMHAYDLPEVIGGAVALGQEIEAQVGLADRVLVSVGGGGLISGISTWFAGRTRVESLEPERAPTFSAATAAGCPVDVSVSGVAADALGAQRIGSLAWAARENISAFHLISDEAILSARQFLWDELRIFVEPSAALGVAALQTGMVRPEAGEHVVLVLCGANTPVN